MRIWREGSGEIRGFVFSVSWRGGCIATVWVSIAFGVLFCGKGRRCNDIHGSFLFLFLLVGNMETAFSLRRGRYTMTHALSALTILGYGNHVHTSLTTCDTSQLRDLTYPLI